MSQPVLYCILCIKSLCSIHKICLILDIVNIYVYYSFKYFIIRPVVAGVTMNGFERRKKQKKESIGRAALELLAKTIAS